MATQGEEFELMEVRVDPVASGRKPEDVLKDLMKAIEVKDLESFTKHLAELERLLQYDNTMGERLTASNALCRAAETGSIPMMEALIEKGADVIKSHVDGAETTPLHGAARIGNVGEVKYLVGKGADVNVTDVSGSTPLHVAAESGSVETVRFLSYNGADIKREYTHGLTPLHIAAEKGTVEAVRLLSRKVADVNIKDDHGWTPLHCAAESGDVEIVTFLSKKVTDVDITDDEGCTPLHRAAWNSKVDAVKCLVGKGADIHSTDNDGNTPMHLATKRGSAAHIVVQYLSKNGANLNSRNYHGMAPVHVATKLQRRKRTVNYLTDLGADINMKNGEEVLEDLKKAIQEGNMETFNERLSEVEKLFSEENRIRSLVASGVLCYAARTRSIPMLEALIQKGVDVNSKSGVIEISGCEQKKEWTPLQVATVRGDVEIVKYLVNKGANVNIRDDDDQPTPLHVAAENGNVEIVSILIDNKADLSLTDEYGGTPLHVAAENRNVDTVRIFIEKGADVGITGGDGATPLHWACRGGNAETVKYLLEKGADPTVEADGNSLSWAIASGHEEVAAILVADNKWEEMMRSSWKGKTLMKNLIAFMPDVAELVFNRCVTTNEGTKKKQLDRTKSYRKVHATSNDFEVEYNYEFLEDFQDNKDSDSAESCCPKKFRKYEHPLYPMVGKPGCSNLLKHPLVISLLEHKWTTFGRYIFFVNLFIYLIFLAFLTAFGLVVLSPLEDTCVDIFNGSFNGTTPENCEGLTVDEYRFLHIGAMVTILTSFLRLAIEIIQLLQHPLEYLLDWVNWLEIPLYLLSIFFTFVFATPCLCVYSWQWQFGVVAIFLGWIGLVIFLQKWHVTGVYILMFVSILRSFVKIAFLALLLVMAFALALYMLFFEPDETRTAFSSPGRAIVKVMAMTIGELDFDDLYHQMESEDEIPFPLVSFILWIVFLVLMPVLLSNLLVGLAVGDVDHLRKTASEYRIGLQIDLVLSFEEMLETLHLFCHYCAIKPLKKRLKKLSKKPSKKPHYPNVPVTLLPWCFEDIDLVSHADATKGRLARFQDWIAERYSKVLITDEYSTSGANISDAIKPPPESLEMQLQKLKTNLSEQSDTNLSKQLRTKLMQQNEQLNEQLDAKLKEHSRQFEMKLNDHSKRLETKLREQSVQLKEQGMQFKEQLDAKLKERSDQLETKLKEQSEQLKEQSGQLESKLNKHNEKQSEQLQEAVRQLSECHEEQAKKLDEQSEQLVGEVASLREALEKLVTKMAEK